jgi:hypothetical protein
MRIFSSVPGIASEASNWSNSISRGSKSHIPNLIASKIDLGTGRPLPNGTA